VVPVAAAVVSYSLPGYQLLEVFKHAPIGLLAIAGSFALFALGTFAALMKGGWNHGLRSDHSFRSVHGAKTQIRDQKPEIHSAILIASLETRFVSPEG